MLAARPAVDVDLAGKPADLAQARFVDFKTGLVARPDIVAVSTDFAQPGNQSRTLYVQTVII
jgi:hypothetical protein